MKILSTILVVTCLICGCRPEELSKRDAMKLIKRDKSYPHIVDYDIITNDTDLARSITYKELDSAGLIVVSKSHAFKKENSLIFFTPKAKPYLLKTVPGTYIQKVKIATEDIKEVKEIIKDYLDSTVLVVYNTEYKNITPFGVMLDSISSHTKQQTAHYTRTKDGWILTNGKNN